MSVVRIHLSRPNLLGVGQSGRPPGLGPGIRKVYVGSNPTVETNLNLSLRRLMVQRRGTKAALDSSILRLCVTFASRDGQGRQIYFG